MKTSRVTDYLEHTLEAVGLACSDVEGMTREDFDADKRTHQVIQRANAAYAKPQ